MCNMIEYLLYESQFLMNLMLIEYLLSFDIALAYISLIFGFTPSFFFSKKEESDRYSKAIFVLSLSC